MEKERGSPIFTRVVLKILTSNGAILVESGTHHWHCHLVVSKSLLFSSYIRKTGKHKISKRLFFFSPLPKKNYFQSLLIPVNCVLVFVFQLLCYSVLLIVQNVSFFYF